MLNSSKHIVDEKADLIFFNIGIFLIFLITGLLLYKAWFLSSFLPMDDMGYILHNPYITSITTVQLFTNESIVTY